MENYSGFLRMQQKQAYEAFSKLWKEKDMDKARAFQWLSEKLHRSKTRLDFSKFDSTLCKKVIELMETIP